MSIEYIVNFEVYNDGVLCRWGNLSVTVHGEKILNASELSDALRKQAAVEADCEPRNIRIVGIFRL